MADPRTLWVSPCGEFAAAMCEDMPKHTLRATSWSDLSNAISGFEYNYKTYLSRVNDPVLNRGFIAVCRRTDLPWENVAFITSRICECGVEIPASLAAFRHTCRVASVTCVGG